MHHRAFFFALLCCASASAAEITTLSGKKIIGDLASLTPQSVALKTGTGEVVTPVTDILHVDFATESATRTKNTEVELTDGSVLACTGVSIKNQQAELTLIGGPVLSTPLTAIRTLLNDAHDAAVRQEWTSLLRKRGALDMLVIKSEGKLDGLDGAFGPGSATGDAIEFSPAGAEQKLSPKLNRLQGLVFVRRPDAGAAPPFCKLLDVAGNVVVVKALKLEGDAVTVELVAGGSVRYPSTKQLVRLDFSKGKLTYLSDLEPIEREESSTEDLVFPFRKDRNLYGGPLRVKGVHYAKGLALHSRAMLTYDIGGDYNEFRAVVGVDDVVRSENGTPVRVNLRVEADGRELLSAVVQSKDEPKAVALDVKNVRRLRITLSSSLLDLGNQLNLCDVRVTK